MTGAALALAIMLWVIPAAAAPFAYVTNLSSNDVSVIDMATNTVVATIPVGEWPEGIGITPNAAFAYVVNGASGTVSVIQTAINTVVATIPVGSIGTTNGINSAAKVTPDGAFVYMTNYLANEVSVIATTTNTVVATVPMPNPICLAITADGAFVYVVNSDDPADTVSVIATATNTVVATAPVGSGAMGVAITPDGAYAYVANRADNTITVIATATNTVVATIAGSGTYPAGVAIRPDGAYAYVTMAGDDAVSVIATATNTAVATVPVESWPIGLAITPDGAYAYVANQFSNSVSVIATATNTVVASIPVGDGPAWVAFIISGLPPTTSALTIAATPSSSQSDEGTPVTFTAKVSHATGSAVPTGTVSFVSGSTVLGKGALNGSSVATYTTSSLPVGTYSVVATYSGDANYAGSSSAATSLSVVAIPTVSLSASSISFPSQYVGTSGLPQTVILTNTGYATLTISGTNTTTSDFGELSACGNSVAPGASCSIGVFFDPTADGTRSGSLTITDNASGSPQEVTLSGMGQDFSMAAGSQTTATVTAGQSAKFMVSVAPGGGFNQTVALSCSGAPAQATCSVSPSSITLKGSSAATAVVTVSTAGNLAALTQPMIARPAGQQFGIWLALSGTLGLPIFMTLAGWRRGRGQLLTYSLAFLFLVAIGSTMLACGGGSASNGGASKTPAGTYDLTVTGSFTSGAANLTHATKFTLVVQ